MEATDAALKEDRKFILAVLKLTKALYYIWQHIPQSLKQNRGFIMTAALNNGLTLKNVDQCW